MGEYTDQMGIPFMKTAWLFPGQASQKVGMGRDLFEESDLGKAYFETANDILGTDIQSIIFDGPEESLRQTQFTQPAIFIVSTLLGGLLRQRGHEPAAAAGHSLGEYSALALGGAFDFKTGLEIVQIRALSMEKAGKMEPGTMAAIVGLDDKQIKSLCEQYNGDGVVVAANYNSQNQIVISGSTIAVKTLLQSAKEAGARMTIPLNVSGAFHSPLMTSAREALAEKLNSLEISDTKFPIYSNVDAKPISKGTDIKDALIRQLENPVLWSESIANMVNNGFSSFVEVGPGKVLQGLNRRIDRNMTIIGVETHEQVLNYHV